MITSSTLSLANLRATPVSSNHVPSEPEPDPVPRVRRLKGSGQLNRWSMARAIRSGRKLERPGHRVQVVEAKPPVRPRDGPSQDLISVTGSVGDGEVDMRGAKSIYMVSDGTGWTAEHSVNAALGQFDHCLVDRGCPVNTHLFAAVRCLSPSVFFNRVMGY